ncbi:MAG: hypothetical protein ACT4OI_02740 [Methanobacteriota archaeon]
MRFFFGPSFRGRFGPLVYVALVLVFVPSGWGAGVVLASGIQDAPPDRAVTVLASPLAAILSFALLYALGTGVTAHPSEFDFLMTSPLRPREYLVADLAFQAVTVFATGGLAIVVSAVAIATTLGRPAVTAAPLLATLGAYVLLVLLVSQVLVVLRVRYVKRPVRAVILVLLAASLLPSIALARPDVPAWLRELPVPSTVFASVAHALLAGDAIPVPDLGIALLYFGAILGAWGLASDVYIFHGVKPTLSAGFGQVDMAARAETQRRLIGGLGRLTTRLRLRPERGGDRSLMTRLHLVRIWRDGSILFVVLFAAVGVLPAVAGPGPVASAATLGLAQMITFLTAVLAMNWSYYERENLWIVLTSARRPSAYFQGLLLGFAAVGVVIASLFLAALGLAAAVRPPVVELALPIVAPISSAFAASALLTRVKIRPSAFSPAIFGILIVVAVVGFLGGFAAQGALLVAAYAFGLGEALQVVVLAGVALTTVAVGVRAVGRLAASFRL